MDVVRLQRSVGNAATASLLRPPGYDDAAVQRAPGAAQDVSKRITLALREARWDAAEAERAMDRLIDSQLEPDETRRFDKSAFRMHLEGAATHLAMVEALLAGVTDLKPFTADAAAVLAPVTQLVEYGDSYGFGASAQVRALQPHMAPLTRWAGTTPKPPAKPRTNTRQERDQGLVLALRAVRASCDDAMAEEPPSPERIAAAAPLISRDLAYARGLTPGRDNAEDVDLASRSLGRMLGWVAEQNQEGTKNSPIKVPAGWDHTVERDIDVMRKWAGLKPDGWKSDVVKGQLVAPDAERPDKNATQQALNQWNDDSLTTIEAVRRWITTNWIAFIGATSQNPRLSWDPGVFDQAASNFVGNLLTELGKNVIQKGSAAIAGALIGSFAGPVGTVIGFVIGLLVETIASVVYSYLFDDTAEKIDQAGRDAAERTGKQAEAKHEEFSDAAEAGRQQQRRAFDAVQTNLAGAGSKAKVDAIGQDLRRDKPAVAGAKNTGDRSLYQAMLSDWVLEHAGDEEDANKNTSEAQWEAARAKTFGKGDLKNKKDLWAYQTRAEWIEAGFDPAVVRSATDAYITTSNKEGVDPEDKYHGQICYMPVVTSPEAFFNYLVRNKAAVAQEDYDYIAKDPAKNVKATCEFDLTTADGTTYVDEWNWTVQLLGRPSRWRTKEVTFDVEPD
ncbi:hypothetical protein [Actinoplanes sp. NPDC049265]|uniref:hypothetical protein n=1 Tax=Actinoplanes sp. NPDC049265 TaxID=3363902 RepID=UPI00371BDA6E